MKNAASADLDHFLSLRASWRVSWNAQDLDRFRGIAVESRTLLPALVEALAPKPPTQFVDAVRELSFIHFLLGDEDAARALIVDANLATPDQIQVCDAWNLATEPHLATLERVDVLSYFWLPVHRAMARAAINVTGSFSYRLPALDAWCNDRGRAMVWLNRQLITIDTPAFLLGSKANYGHWITDYLPRMAKYPGDRDLPLLVRDDLPETHRSALRILGFDDAMLRLIPADAIVRCEQLVVASTPRRERDFAPWALLWLRQRFGPTTPTGAPRIYVSRSDAEVRRVLNEDELVAKLKPLGFEIVVPGKLSFRDQVAAFSGAKCILGMHGAGLANMVFAPEDVTLIEILPAANRAEINESMAMFYDISLTRRIRYRAVPSSPQPTHPSLKERDVIVDIGQVLRAIPA